MRPSIQIAAVACVGLLQTACGALRVESSPWDLLSPDSPCYDVDLIDGLDDDDITELHSLFACVNLHGHVEPLVPLDEVLDVETRSGVPIGLEAARLVNHMGDIDLDPFAVAGVLLDAIRAEDRPVDEILDITLELIWGDRATRVRSGSIATTDTDAMQLGVWVPLGPVVPVAAAALIADDHQAMAFAGELLGNPQTERWVRTLASALESEHAEVTAPLEPALVHLGEAVLATRSPGNDRWSNASGDSLRDLADFFIVRDNPVVDQISPAMDAMLGDPLVHEGLIPAIDGLQEDGHLIAIPDQLVWLANADVDGSPVEPNEASALYRFVRLLANNNHSVDCSIDLFGFPIFQWSFGNFAVETLRLIADMSPGEVQDLAALLTDLTGNPVSQELIDLAVDSGVCPDFDQQTMDDLAALEAISHPSSTSLLAGFIELLTVLENGQTDHIPAFADLGEALFVAGGLEPFEEAVRDLGGEPVLKDSVALVPVMVHPFQYDLSGGDDADPIDLRDALELVQWSFARDPQDGLTGFQRMRPLLSPVLAEDGTWVALGNGARLLADDRTQSSQALDLLPRVLALDDELILLEQLGPLLADRALSEPFLRILETNQLVDQVLATTPSGDQGQVPMTFYGSLVIEGTLEDVLRLVDTLVAALE